MTASLSERPKRTGRPFFVGGAGTLGSEPRLADAGLARDQDELALPGPRSLPGLPDLSQLPLAAYEGGAFASHRKSP